MFQRNIPIPFNRPRPSQAPPPTSGERVHNHPPPGEYPTPLTNSRPPPQDPHRESGPRRPYPPTRPPYGALPPSRISGQPPRGPPYRPPVPQSGGPSRPSYSYPPRVQGEPHRPQEGAPQYVASVQPQTDSSERIIDNFVLMVHVLTITITCVVVTLGHSAISLEHNPLGHFTMSSIRGGGGACQVVGCKSETSDCLCC